VMAQEGAFVPVAAAIAARVILGRRSGKPEPRWCESYTPTCTPFEQFVRQSNDLASDTRLWSAT
jgi:hypothetical protein